MITAIDAGNYNTKFFDGKTLRKFPSVVGMDTRERNLDQVHGDYDFEWSYEKKSGYAGTLAQYESLCGESRRGDTKAHFDAKLRTLIALHQFTDATEHEIVVGQPIKKHTKVEKERIKQMFIGKHDLTVNGKRKILVIKNCEVAAEGASSGLLLPNVTKTRVIDIGSGTVNYATIENKRFIDKESFTLGKGLETFENIDLIAFARQIAVYAINKDWSESDVVCVCGGGAEKLCEALKDYFPNVQILLPDAEYSNVRAFYMIARKLYG